MRALLIAAIAAVALAAAAWQWLQSPGGTGSIARRAAQPALVEVGEDLPPAGTRSLFDHLVGQNEGVPYPFEQLAALVRAQDPAGAQPVQLLVPDGRSLLKAQAHAARPRVLLAADFQSPGSEASLGLAARGALFLGFVEDAHEIEVISYNEAAGRYEFQLVQDYREGGTPRIVYARRAICLTCHQGAAPIFSQRPWNETNGQPAIARHIAEARGDSPYAGVPVALPLSVPERYDELTEVANFVPAAQRVWREVCGDAAGGEPCRRALVGVALEFALDPGRFDPDGRAAVALREAQARHWPAAGIPVAEPDLRSRDPLIEGVSFGEMLGSWLPRRTPRSNEDLEAFERLRPLPPELDPLQPRPPRRVLAASDLDGAFALAQLLTPSDLSRLECAARSDRARLLDAVAKLPAAALDPRAFQRVALVRGLLKALGQPEPAYGFLDVSELSPPQSLGVPPLELAAGSPLEPFAKYCFACHRGNPARRLNFMAGADEAAVLAAMKQTDSIRDALDWERYRGTDKETRLMPPADSRQRRELEAALAQQPRLLEDMRKVVPSMFEF